MSDYSFDTFYQYYDHYYTNVIDEEIASDIVLINKFEDDLYEQYTNYEARVRAQEERAAARAEAAASEAEQE
jgi:hypothetical protein